jgi:hypothetical protein
VDVGVVIKSRYLWNTIIDGCHYTDSSIENIENGKKKRKKKRKKNKGKEQMKKKKKQKN